MKPSFDVVPSDRLGKYELVRHLASGGMARIYLARVVGVGGFERHVVLKTVRPERVEDESYLTMFLDEARLLAMLHHQHVAQVYEVGVADDGTYFLAMEYLHGETVRAALARARHRKATIPFDYSLTVVGAAASGLHHAHERRGHDGQPLGIVHRDVSPSNIICGYDGSVKLIDFGIAKAEARTTVTQTGFVKGKAGYMAPEQALGYPVDRRSDVYALGVVLYELTTQHRAFRAATEHEAVQRMVRGDVTPPSKVVPGFPRDLEDVVLHALELDPDDRFRTTEEMRGAIDRVAAQLGVAIGPTGVMRTLDELFGARPEPWLAGSPLADEGEAQVTTESAVVAVMSGPQSRPPEPIPEHQPLPLPPPVAPLKPETPRTRAATVSLAPIGRGGGGQDAPQSGAPPHARMETGRTRTSSTTPPRQRSNTIPPLAPPPVPPRTRTTTLPPIPSPSPYPQHPRPMAASPSQASSQANRVAKPTTTIPASVPPMPRPNDTAEDIPTRPFATVEDLRNPGLAPAYPPTGRTLPGTGPMPLLPSLPGVSRSPSAPGMARSPSAPRLTPTTHPTPPSMRAVAVGTAPPPFRPIYAPQAGATRLPRLPRRRVLMIALPCAAVLGAALALWAVPGDDVAAPATSTATSTGAASTGTSTPPKPKTSGAAPHALHPQPLPQPQVQGPAPEPAPGMIQLHVVTDPPGGTVVLDGVRLGNAPFDGTVPAQPGKEGTLKVRMHGYAAVKERVDLGHDVSWDVPMHRTH